MIDFVLLPVQSELLAYLFEESPATQPPESSLPTGQLGGGREGNSVLTPGLSMVGAQAVTVAPTQELSAYHEHFPQHSPSPSPSSSDTSSVDEVDFCDSLLNPVPEVVSFCEQANHATAVDGESLSLYDDYSMDSILPDFGSLDSLDLESFLCTPTPLLC